MKEIQLEYGQSKDGRTVDPEAFGLHGIAQLGVSRFLRARVPTAEHIHRGMLEIGFCLRSPLALKVRGCESPVMPGSFFVNQPNVPHCLTSRPNGLYVYYFLMRKPTADRTLIDLPRNESSAIWKRLLRLPATIPAGIRAGQVRELFTRLFQLCDQPVSPWTSVQMRQIMLALLVLLLELAEKPADAECSARVAKVIEQIRTHPEQHFTIDALAREAALSPTHFINQFRKVTGFPPIRYQIECRIQQAKKMLRESYRKVSDVALQLGFNSPQHFTDTFSRIVGTTPSHWRYGSYHQFSGMLAGRPLMDSGVRPCVTMKSHGVVSVT